MLNALDLLIVVVMVLAAASLLALCLMFLVRNKTVKQVCFYLVAAMSVYLGYVGFRINWPGFLPQVILAVGMALTGIGAVVLECLGRNSEKKLRIARLLAAAALVIGFANAFM